MRPKDLKIVGRVRQMIAISRWLLTQVPLQLFLSINRVKNLFQWPYLLHLRAVAGSDVAQRPTHLFVAARIVGLQQDPQARQNTANKHLLRLLVVASHKIAHGTQGGHRDVEVFVSLREKNEPKFITQVELCVQAAFIKSHPSLPRVTSDR